MKTRSVLTAGKYTDADYDAGQGGAGRAHAAGRPAAAGAPVRPAVRSELGKILCGESQADELPQGRHRRLQGHHHPRLEDAADRREVGRRGRPGARTRRTRPPTCKKLKVPYRSWIKNMRRARASTTPPWRRSTTAPARCWAYAGSASFYAKGNRKFQPQFDVLEDGWRQPGSAFKPINYVIGIEDKTLTAATHVHGRQDELRQGLVRPTTPTASSAGRSGCGRPSRARSTSRPSRRPSGSARSASGSGRRTSASAGRPSSSRVARRSGSGPRRST